MVASLFAWRAGCIERRSYADWQLPSPSMTFRLWPSAILWAMLTPKHGSQPFPPKGQGQPTFHTRIESVPACLPVEGRAVAWLAKWVSIQ